MYKSLRNSVANTKKAGHISVSYNLRAGLGQAKNLRKNHLQRLKILYLKIFFCRILQSMET